MLGLIFFFSSLNDFCVHVVHHRKAYLMLVDINSWPLRLSACLFLSIDVPWQKKGWIINFYSQFLGYKCRGIKVMPVQSLWVHTQVTNSKLISWNYNIVLIKKQTPQILSDLFSSYSFLLSINILHFLATVSPTHLSTKVKIFKKIALIALHISQWLNTGMSMSLMLRWCWWQSFWATPF